MATSSPNKPRGNRGASNRRNGAEAANVSAADLPPMDLLIRSRDGVEMFTVSSDRSADPSLGAADAKEGERNFILKGPTSFQVVHPEGKCAFVHRPEVGVFKLDLETKAEAAAEPFLAGSGRVQVMEISPKGSYVLTWERPPAGEAPNLKIWSSETGEFLAGFRQKALRREAWPHVQWTQDESLAFLLCTNEVRVYDGHFKADVEARFVDKLYVTGISSMSVGPSSSRVLFVSFSPNEKKGNKPSRACLYEYTGQKQLPDSENGATDADTKKATKEPCTMLMSKSMYQAEEMKVHWNPRGDSALVALSSSVDVSGQSYYGSAVLYLMSPPLPTAQPDKNRDQSEPIEVYLPQEGPVLDVAWMPNPRAKPQAFVVIAGRMPPMASLHSGVNGKPTFVFGNAHRNTIAWAPHGRFVCLAGFGNLAGGMTFWDRNKLKQIPPAHPVTASCTVGYGWSPDSRLFISSTTSPRMNVDNGLKLFRYNGEAITKVPWDNKNYLPNKLLQASFIPKPAGVYPDRPQSPSLRDAQQSSDPSAGAQEAQAAAPGRYIPPSARNRTTGGGTSLADRMRAEKEGGMRGAQRVTGREQKRSLTPRSRRNGGVPGQKSIPGLAPASNTPANKNKNAKRGKPKKSDERWVKMSLDEALLAKEKAKKEAAEKKAQEAAAKETEEAAAEPREEPKPEPEPVIPVDPAKRERKVRKSLREIDGLKERDLLDLNEDQRKKLEQEMELRAELEQLAALNDESGD